MESEIIYTYDADGKRTSKQTEGETLTYRYDPGYQLVEVTGGSNRESYSFDVDGRVEAIDRDGSSLTLEHDTYDRLIQAGEVSYTYDGMNRRVQSTGPVERNFLVAPALETELESIHQVVDGFGATVAKYVYAGMDPLLRTDSMGTTYYLTDGIGSVIGLVDEAGRKVADFQYDGFGNLRSAMGSEATVPTQTAGDFRFQGQWLEGSTGLYHFRARDYDPVVGRFLSRDPAEPVLEEPESLDPYQYAYGNPKVYGDPEGTLTLLSINASFTIKDALEKSRAALVNHIKDEFVDRARGILGNIIIDFFESVLPFHYRFIQAGFAVGRWLPGIRFERIILNGMCFFLSEGYPSASEYLWREPAVARNGKPLTSGKNCLGYRDPASSIRGIKKGDSARPDYIFKSGSPLQPRPKGLLIGDIKYSLGGLYKDYFHSPARKRAQWDAITNYAKYPNRHAYVPLTFFIAFKATTRVYKSGSIPFIIQTLNREAFQANVIVFLAIMFD